MRVDGLLFADAEPHFDETARLTIRKIPPVFRYVHFFRFCQKKSAFGKVNTLKKRQKNEKLSLRSRTVKKGEKLQAPP